MKHLRQSLEAKKNKKPRRPPLSPSSVAEQFDAGTEDADFPQDLRDVQVDVEMHEKLQRWLHRVASNATHLSEAETVPHPQPMGGHANHAGTAMNLFDRVRRKSANTGLDGVMGGGSSSGGGSSRQAGSLIHPFSRAGSVSSGGGARKKDSYPSVNAGGRGGANGGGGGGGATAMMSTSAYARPMDEFCMIAKDYEKATGTVPGAAKKKQSSCGGIVGAGGGGAEDRFTSSSLSAQQIDRRMQASGGGGGGLGSAGECGPGLLSESERLKKRRESSQFEERLLTQFYDGSPQCENLFRAFATTSATTNSPGAKGAATVGGEAGGCASGGGGLGGDSTLSSRGEMVSKFRWRFHSDGGNANNNSRDHQHKNGTGPTQALQGEIAEAEGNSEAFLNSLLLKSSRSKPTHSKAALKSGATTATQTVAPLSMGYERDYRRWADTVEHVVVQRMDAEREMAEVATVIIERADEATGEEALLEAACSEILNDPEAFDEEEEGVGLGKRFELVDLLALQERVEGNGSGDRDEEEVSLGDSEELSILKNNGYFDLEEDDEDGEEEEEDCDDEDDDDEDDDKDGEEEEEDDDDPVLLYEDVETGRAAFLGGGAHRKVDFWGNFDSDEDVEEGCGSGSPLNSHVAALDDRPASEISDDDIAAASTDGLEFDDFAYFAPRIPNKTTATPPNNPVHQQNSSSGSSFRKQTLPAMRHEGSESGLLPRVVAGEDHSLATKQHRPLDHMGGERQMGPSLPEIINRGAERGRREQSQFGVVDVSPGAVKREREERSCLSRVQLPDMKVLESDLKMMGLDMILNDSDDSFERTIKRHFRSESRGAMAKQQQHGECLLRSGNEELKRMKPVDDTADWLIQLDVELANPVTATGEDQEQAEKAAAAKKKANRCAKCNKKLGIIMIMQCHCGLIFCAQHRYAEAHNCAYDFKEEGKRILAKENPLVVGEKLPKI